MGLPVDDAVKFASKVKAFGVVPFAPGKKTLRNHPAITEQNKRGVINRSIHVRLPPRT